MIDKLINPDSFIIINSIGDAVQQNSIPIIGGYKPRIWYQNNLL